MMSAKIDVYTNDSLQEKTTENSSDKCFIKEVERAKDDLSLSYASSRLNQQLQEKTTENSSDKCFIKEVECAKDDLSPRYASSRLNQQLQEKTTENSSDKCFIKEVERAKDDLSPSYASSRLNQQLQEQFRGPGPEADDTVKIITYMGGTQKPLFPASFSEHFLNFPIEIEEFENIEYLFESIDSNIPTTHFFIINSSQNLRSVIDQAHSCKNIHAMYVLCESPQLTQLRRLARNYPKLDGVYDESLRLLIKVIMDVALFCQETASRQKHDALATNLAHRNYQRSIDLYKFATNFLSSSMSNR